MPNYLLCTPLPIRLRIRNFLNERELHRLHYVYDHLLGTLQSFLPSWNTRRKWWSLGGCIFVQLTFKKCWHSQPNSHKWPMILFHQINRFYYVEKMYYSCGHGTKVASKSLHFLSSLVTILLLIPCPCFNQIVKYLGTYLRACGRRRGQNVISYGYFGKCDAMFYWHNCCIQKSF